MVEKSVAIVTKRGRTRPRLMEIVERWEIRSFDITRALGRTLTGSVLRITASV